MKKISAVIALLLCSLLIAGCNGQPAGGNASVEELYNEIKGHISEDLRNLGFGDDDFDAEELPGYAVIDLKGEEADWVLAELNKDDVQEGFVIKAAMMLNSDQIILIKAAPGKVNEIKAVLEAEHAAQLDLWENYLADQAVKVRDTIISVQGDFIIYITYPDAEGIEAIFDDAM